MNATSKLHNRLRLSRKYVFKICRILCVLTAVAGCSKRGNPAVANQSVRNLPVPIMTAVAVQKTVPLQLKNFGTVEAYTTVGIKAQVAGILTEVHFKEGQDVKKDDLLFTIDPRPFEASLKQAEANLAKDTALSENATVEAGRMNELLKKGVESQGNYDQARATADSLQASIKADNAAIEMSKLQLEYCYIRSPVDGRTGAFQVDLGNLVKANDITMVEINQIKPINVMFSVPQKYLNEIRKYMAEGPLAVEAAVPDDEKPVSQGVLTFVDDAVDVTTGTIKLKAKFANEDERLWPGQFVNVTLTLTQEPNVVVIPSRAIQPAQEGQQVFVVKPDMTVEVRPITVDHALDDESVIKEGLTAGEIVVTDGQLRLVNGSKVEIKEAASQSAPTANPQKAQSGGPTKDKEKGL